MYPVSQDVINLFKANQYQQAKVEVFTPAANVLEPVNGVPATPDLTIGSDRILQNGLVVDRYCVTGEKLEIGTAIAAELTLKLNNRDGYFDNTVFKGKWLKAQVGIKDWSDEIAAITWISLGWFVVDSAPRKLSTITISALDFMALLNTVSTPQQISAFATYLKSQNLGYALEHTTFGSDLAPHKTVIDSSLQERANNFTSNFLPLPDTEGSTVAAGVPAAADWLSKLEEGERTRRQSVIWVAQILGACAYIDNEGALHFGWCQDSGVTITSAERYSSDMAEDDVILTGVSYTEYVEQTDGEDDEAVTYESDKTYLAGNTTGLVVDITSNRFIRGESIESFLSGLYGRVAGTTYRPFEAKAKPCPYLWPMDKITYVDAEGVSHNTIITNITFTINAPTSIAAKGDLSSGDSTAGTSATSRVASDVSDLADRVGRVETDTEAFNRLIALKADITDLKATNAVVDNLKTGKADVGDLAVTNAEVESLKTSKADVADLNATNAEINSLKTDKADVDMLNVVKATIENLLVRGGIITDSLSGVEINATKFLTGVTIIGDVIKAGTLQADRIILTGENGLIYELNVNAGNLTASQLTQEQYKQALDGSVLVASSITTDKLAAGSVTTQVIASGAVDTDKLAANAVKAISIDAGAITTDKLASKAVTSDKVETGAITTDKLAANSVKAKNIDTENLFSQDLTASGKIKSANYNGTELSPLANTEGSILKMDDGTFNLGGGRLVFQNSDDGPVLIVDGRISGKDILIKGEDTVTNDDYTVHVTNKIETSFNNTGDPETSSATMIISQKYDDGDEAPEAALIFKNGVLTLSGAVSADVGCYSENWPYEEFADTSGLSGVFTAGQLTVTKKMGVCWISGTITLSKSISGWKTILNDGIVPPPQHRTLVPFTVPQWSSSYTQPLRGKILANGGLQIQGGAAKEYVFTMSYPID